MIPRGIRNNNPGNIRWGDSWAGLVPRSSRMDPTFCQFVDPVYGIRAIARILGTYYDIYRLYTVRGIISRWAPPNENDTESYIQNVAKQCGVKPDDVLHIHVDSVLMGLIKGIIQHENGEQPYPDQLIEQGIQLAK